MRETDTHMSAKRSVTIEGSITPSVILPRGQRRTVALTDEVQALIDRGFVVIVPDPDNPLAAHEQQRIADARAGAAKAAKASNVAPEQPEVGDADAKGSDNG